MSGARRPCARHSGAPLLRAHRKQVGDSCFALFDGGYTPSGELMMARREFIDSILIGSVKQKSKTRFPMPRGESSNSNPSTRVLNRMHSESLGLSVVKCRLRHPKSDVTNPMMCRYLNERPTTPTSLA